MTDVRVSQTVKLVDRQPDADLRITQVVKLVDRQPDAVLRVSQIVKLIDVEIPFEGGRRRAAFF